MVSSPNTISLHLKKSESALYRDSVCFQIDQFANEQKARVLWLAEPQILEERM
jgi:hypothetical protein